MNQEHADIDKAARIVCAALKKWHEEVNNECGSGMIGNLHINYLDALDELMMLYPKDMSGRKGLDNATLCARADLTAWANEQILRWV